MNPFDWSLTERILGEELSGRLLLELEEKARAEDLYQVLAQESRRMGERLRGPEAQETLQRLSRRLSMPVDPAQPRGLQPFERQPSWITRPTTATYQRFLQQENVRLALFQVQETTTTRLLLNPARDDVRVVTQRLRLSGNKEEDRTAASILAGNELTRLATRPERVRAVQHPYTFHLKLGSAGRQAYIATQNLTPTLGRNNTYESMLLLDRDSQFAAERELAEEINAFLDWLLPGNIADKRRSITRMLSEQPRHSFASIAELTSRERRGLFVNEEILPMLERLFQQFEQKKKDRMIISMGEISLLSRREQTFASGLVEKIYRGLESGRIEIITDRNKLDKAIETALRIKELEEKSYRSLREDQELERLRQEAPPPQFLEAVAAGKIRPGLFGYHHDKAYAVFGSNLKALVLGSANLSGPSLLPLAERSEQDKLRFLQQLGFSEQEIQSVIGLRVEEVRERLKQTGLPKQEREILSVLAAPAAVETVAALSSKDYKLGRRNKPLTEATDYLVGIEPEVRRHFEAAAGRLENTLLTSGRIQAKLSPETSEQVLVGLLRNLKEIDEGSQGALEVVPHYESRQGRITLVEIEVNINPVTFGGRTTLILTATNEGNVVIANKNKIIVGSVVINNDNRILELSIGTQRIRLAPGQSRNLNAVETATAVVSTIARRVRLEQLYEEPTRWYLSKVETQEGRLQILQGIERLMAQTIVRVDTRGLLREAESIDDVLRILGQLEEEDRARLVEMAATDLSKGISSGIALSDRQKQERREAFTPFYRLGNFVTGKVLSLLQTSAGKPVVSDILLRLYLEEALQSPAARISLRRATKAAVDSIVDAFLPLSQLGYSGMQGQYRVPVLEVERPRRGFSQGDDFLFRGTVAPAFFSHATPLQGAYMRLMGATAHESPKRLTPAGTYRFLEVEDNSLTQGAASVYVEQVFKSVVGLSVLQPEDQTLKDLGVEQEGQVLFRFPYAASRTDQLPARLKNLLGGRPLADINPAALEYALSLGTSRKPTQVAIGRIMPLLPEKQAEIVLAEMEAIQREHPDWNREAVRTKATIRLREKQLQPESTLGGIIGGSRPRRIALTLGGNLLGDYNLGNADYFQPVGQLTPLKVTFSVQNDEQLPLIEQISKFLSQDTFFLPAERTFYVGDRLQTFTPGVYKLVDGQPQRIAGFDLEGRVVVGETTRPWGDLEVIEKITMKVPVFSKRFNQNAVGWIPGNKVAISRSGSRVTLETEVWTFFETDSTHRQGFGPFKNLMNLVQGRFFEALDATLPGTFRILDKNQQPLYALVSPSTLKGHVFQTGAEILVRPELRRTIQEFIQQDTQKAAAALAVSFADEQLKQTLVAYLRRSDQPRVLDMADALERSRVRGLPDRESVLTAPGMMTLGGRLRGSYQEIAAGFRRVLQEALQGNSESLETLRQGLLETLSRGIQAVDEKGFVVQGDPVTYGAAALTELLTLGRQIVEGPQSKYDSQPRRLEDWERFKKDRDHSHIVRSLAAVVGVDLTGPGEDAIKGKLQFLASRMDSLISIEMLVEGLPSSALVTMGGEREVDIEFHTLMSLGQLTLDVNIPRYGRQTVAEEIRRTFTVLSSLNLITGEMNFHRTEVPPVVVAFAGDVLDDRPALSVIAETRERALLTLPGINEQAMAVRPEIGRRIFQAIHTQYKVEPDRQMAVRAAMATLAGIDEESRHNLAEIAALSPTGIEHIDQRINQHIAYLLNVEPSEPAARLLGRALSEVAREAEGNIRTYLSEAEPNSFAGLLWNVFRQYPDLERSLFSPYGTRAIEFDGQKRRPRLEIVDEAIRAVEVAMDKATAQAITKILKLPTTLGKQYSAAMSRSQDPMANLNIRLVLPSLEALEEEQGIRVRIGREEWTEGLIMGREMIEVLPLTYTGSTEHEALTHQVEIASILSRRRHELEVIEQASLTGQWSPHITPEAFADIERLRELLAETQADARELISTSLAARAAGAKLPGAGVTGFPASDLTLGTQQVYVGEAVRSITTEVKEEHRRRFGQLYAEAPEDLKPLLQEMAKFYDVPRELLLDKNQRRILYGLRRLRTALEKREPVQEIQKLLNQVLRASGVDETSQKIEESKQILLQAVREDRPDPFFSAQAEVDLEDLRTRLLPREFLELVQQQWPRLQKQAETIKALRALHRAISTDRPIEEVRTLFRNVLQTSEVQLRSDNYTFLQERQTQERLDKRYAESLKVFGLRVLTDETILRVGGISAALGLGEETPLPPEVGQQEVIQGLRQLRRALEEGRPREEIRQIFDTVVETSGTQIRSTRYTFLEQTPPAISWDLKTFVKRVLPKETVQILGGVEGVLNVGQQGSGTNREVEVFLRLLELEKAVWADRPVEELREHFDRLTEIAGVNLNQANYGFLRKPSTPVNTKEGLESLKRALLPRELLRLEADSPLVQQVKLVERLREMHRVVKEGRPVEEARNLFGQIKRISGKQLRQESYSFLNTGPASIDRAYKESLKTFASQVLPQQLLDSLGDVGVEGVLGLKRQGNLSEEQIEGLPQKETIRGLRRLREALEQKRPPNEIRQHFEEIAARSRLSVRSRNYSFLRTDAIPYDLKTLVKRTLPQEFIEVMGGVEGVLGTVRGTSMQSRHIEVLLGLQKLERAIEENRPRGELLQHFAQLADTANVELDPQNYVFLQESEAKVERPWKQAIRNLTSKLLSRESIRLLGDVGKALIRAQPIQKPENFLVRRSGAPFMMSAGTATPLYQQAWPWQEAGPDQIAPPKQRMATATLLPMVSSWWRDQGDVDGDAYQFLRTSVPQLREQFLQEVAATLNAPEEEREIRLISLESLKRQLEEELERLDQPPVETEELRFWKQKESEIDRSSPIYQRELERQLRSRRTSFSIQQARIVAEERARFGEVLEFTVGWLGLPREAAQYLTPAEAQAMTTLFRAPLADLDGSRARSIKALERGEKAQKILKYIQSQEPLRRAWAGTVESIEPFIGNIENALPEVRGEVRSLLSEVLRHDYLDVDPRELGKLINSYKAFSAAGRAAAAEGVFDAFQKLMAKGMGTFLNEEQLMGVEAAIGTAGGSLLGPTFNILTPMAMDVFEELVFAEALKNPQFVSTLQEQIQNARYSPQRDELLADIQNPERMSVEAKNRFTVVRDAIASLQTLLREAIKSRGERGLAAEVVTPFEIDGVTATLAEHLNREGIDRAEVLNRFISRTMGPELGDEYGITGLGALHLLHRYTSVGEEGLEQLADYARSLGAPVDEDIATTIADALNRTVASFRASRFGDHAQKALDIFNLLPSTPGREQARTRIREKNLIGTAALTEYLLEEVRSSGVFTPETVRGLRETAIYRRKAKIELEDAEGHAQRIDNIYANTTTVLLSLLQRANQMDPNTLISGTFGLYSAFARARERVGRRLSTPTVEFLGGKKALLRNILSTSEIGSQLAQASTAYAAMHGLAAEMAVLQEMADASPENREAIQARIAYLRQQLQEIEQNEFAYRQQADPKIRAYAARTEEEIQRLVTPQAQETQRQIEEAMKVIAEDKAQEMLDIKSIISQPNNLIDVLLGPSLIALASGGVGLDERGLLFGIDVLQSIAMTRTFQSWRPSETAQQLREVAGRLGMPEPLAESLIPEWVGKPGTDPANLVARMRMGRIRGVLSSSETTLGGAFRAMLQESLIAGVGTLVQSGVARMFGQNLAGRAVAEVAGTLTVLSVSRSFAARVTGNPHVPDFVERLLQEFATQVWMAVEQVQLFLNSAEGMLYDEETETTIDFDAEAFPGQVTEGMETGLIVVDPEDNILPSQGDPYLGMYETVSSLQHNNRVN